MHRIADAHSHCLYTEAIPMILCATSEASWSGIQAATGKNVTKAIGIHPWFLDSRSNEWAEHLEAALMQDENLHVGECGLDLYRDIPLETQQAVFQKHIDLAGKYKRLLIIHAVKCWDQLLPLLRRKKLRGGVVHRFGGSLEIARELIKLGFRISVGYELLERSSARIRGAVTAIPLDSLLVESDAEECLHDTELHLEDTVYEIARLRGESPDTVKEALWKNFKSMLWG